MENLFLICTNKNCKEGRWGGNFIEIPAEKEEEISCPDCGQKYYIAEDKSFLTKFDGKPVLFESFSDFNTFLESYTNKRLYIETLHLKGISDNENFEKTFSYNSCFIEKLIIEDVDLKTPCFPIVFDQCFIDKITIRNCRISEDEKKDFWGPKTFYGINFNETEIFQQIEIDNYTGDLMFKACKIEEPIKISNSKIKKLNLNANAKEPTLELNNTSIVYKLVSKPLGENEEQAEPLPSVDSKKVAEYQVKNAGNGLIKIQNKHIGNLIFSKDEAFQSPIKFINCQIDFLDLVDRHFNQNVEFTNCHFKNPVTISKTTFQKLLSFEACYFVTDFILDEVSIGTDLHLSYSTFSKTVSLNHTNISGFMTMHQARVNGLFNLERCVLNQNMTLVNSVFNKVLVHTVEFHHEVFINTCQLNDECIIKFSNIGGSVDFNRSYLNKDVTLSTVEINADFRITDSFLTESLNLTFCNIKGETTFAQSSFLGKVDFLLVKLSSLWFFSNRFFSNLMLNASSTEKTNRSINNIFYQQFIVYQSTLVDQIMEYNLVFEKFDLDDIDCDDISLESNSIKEFFAKNVVCGKFVSNNDKLGATDISEIVCQKKFSFHNATFNDKTTINQSKLVRSVEFMNCVFENDFEVENNNFGNSLRIENTTFDGFENEIANLTIVENDLTGSLQFNKVTLNGKTEILKNNIGQEFYLKYSLINPELEEDKKIVLRSFERGLWVQQNNVVHNVQLKYLEGEAPVYFENNLVTGSVIIGGDKRETTFESSISISKNRLRALEIEDCQLKGNTILFNNHIEGGFSLSNVIFNKVCDISGTYVGGSGLFANISFNRELILDNAFFDKRLDFSNCYPNTVSFKGSTLHGFNMPSNWKMFGGRLCSKENTKKKILIDEQLIFEKKEKGNYTYGMTSALLLDDPNKLKILKQNWRAIKENCLAEGEEIESLPEELITLLYYDPLIVQMLKDEFFPLYYQFIEPYEIEEITNATSSLVQKLEEDSVGSPVIDNLTEFCNLFEQLLSAFTKMSNNEEELKLNSNLKPLLYERLQDQYLVVKEIYGGNGELGDEDRAYFRWMHYKNLFDFQLSKWYQKPAKMFKWLIFENVFGWGVNLFRIFGSTILLVLLFTGIYWVGGQLNPELSINWDGVDVPIAMLDLGNLLLLTLQTTFAAFMGDWSPAGLGSMKVWMTINAVLGVLLVAFLIGAYGRKMLR